MSQSGNAITIGTTLAVVAAVTLGATTPIIQRYSRGLDSFTIAALLYAGASVVSAPALWDRSAREAPVLARNAVRLLVVALFGAVVAPVCIAWGLHRTRGTTASLLLTFEALFTVVLARVFFREHIGRRVWFAMGAIAMGAMLLVMPNASMSGATLAGSIAIVLATLGWSVDNALTRGPFPL